MLRRKRILFVSESITLAQIVRLAVLAKALDPARYDVHFAASDFPDYVEFPLQRWNLWGLSAAEAQARLARGKRIYSRRVLRRYIASDAEVIETVRPDLVVADLRWSLAISAVKRQIPVAALINAYWSRFALRAGFPLPDHPLVRLLGEALATKHFPKALPYVFRHFAAPLNQLREQAGLPPLGDLQDVLNFGDFVLFPDPPDLVPTRPLPANHRFLGAIVWSAPGTLPEGWGKTPGKVPIYVTMGSSGNLRAVDAVLRALADLPVDVLWTTAGRAPAPETSAGVHVARFVDGNAACAKAGIVIHNGGSSTGYQALLAGTPVLGIPSNLDQSLASECIEAAGAGLTLRSGSLDAGKLRTAITRLLDEPGFAEHAHRLSACFRVREAADEFRRFVAEVV